MHESGHDQVEVALKLGINAKPYEEEGGADGGMSRLATISGEMTREAKIIGAAAYRSPAC